MVWLFLFFIDIGLQAAQDFFFFLFCIIFTLTSIFTQCPVRFGKDHDLNIIKKDLLNLTEFIFDLDFFLKYFACLTFTVTNTQNKYIVDYKLSCAQYYYINTLKLESTVDLI